MGIRINTLNLQQNVRLWRLLNTNLALNTTIASGRKNQTRKPQNEREKNEQRDITLNPSAYVDFSIPWNITAGLIFSQSFIGQTPQRSTILNFNGDISLTEKWKIAINTGYDFVRKDFSFTSVDIFRDLHCWEMRFNWIPFGFRQSYNFSINVKSSMLQDLKLNRRRQWFDLTNE